MEQRSFLKSQYLLNQESPCSFIEPEGLLLCLHEPLTGSYPDPHEPSPVYSKSVLIDLPTTLLPSGFPTKICMQFSSVPCVLHALPISSFLNLITPVLYYFCPQRFRYFPQHVVLKNPQSLLFL